MDSPSRACPVLGWHYHALGYGAFQPGAIPRSTVVRDRAIGRRKCPSACFGRCSNVISINMLYRLRGALLRVSDSRSGSEMERHFLNAHLVGYGAIRHRKSCETDKRRVGFTPATAMCRYGPERRADGRVRGIGRVRGREGKSIVGPVGVSAGRPPSPLRPAERLQSRPSGCCQPGRAEDACRLSAGARLAAGSGVSPGRSGLLISGCRCAVRYRPCRPCAGGSALVPAGRRRPR